MGGIKRSPKSEDRGPKLCAWPAKMPALPGSAPWEAHHSDLQISSYEIRGSAHALLAVAGTEVGRGADFFSFSGGFWSFAGLVGSAVSGAPGARSSTRSPSFRPL